MQYLDKDFLLNTIAVNINEIKKDSLISSDTYNESEILQNFQKLDIKIQKNLLKCAIHISIIGAGQKSYGSIRDDNNEVIKIGDLFNKHNILYNKNLNEKYDPNALSARRLVRLLRYQIQLFIIQENRPSYLWLKYSDKDKSKIGICFPGAEHLVENSNDALYLISTYKKLDEIQGTGFVQRLQRVFIARNILMPNQF